MDFETFISLMFLFFFFVLPSILRQLRKKKLKEEAAEQPAETGPQEVPAPVKVKKTRVKGRPGLLTKLADQIRNIFKELEEQQRQHQKKAAQQETSDVWQELADREFTREAAVEETPIPASEPVREIYPPSPRKYMKPAQRSGILTASEKIKMPHDPGDESAVSKKIWRKNGLQNAVVWAEILGKPVALKEGDRF